MVRHARNAWIETATGSELDKTKFLREISKKQVVILGESHDIAEIHRWQLHTANYLHAFRPKMLKIGRAHV